MTSNTAFNIKDVKELKLKRLLQITTASMIGLSLTSLVSYLDGRYLVSTVMVLGIALMFFCQQLAQTGREEYADVILLSSITIIASVLMWMNEGLKDSAFLTFPVILIIAGLLVKLWQFVVLLVVMLLYIFFLTFATTRWGLRVDTSIASYEDILKYSSIILLVAGSLTWLVISDFVRSFSAVKRQFDQAIESQSHFAYLSQHDVLTKMPNRSLGRERIEQAILNAERHMTGVAVLFVDLDHFKDINDSLGHAAGDEFLIEVSSRLKSSVRKSDIVCRHGGDEFIVCITDVMVHDDIVAAASNITAAINKEFTLHEAQLDATCSVGVAVYPYDGLTYEDLLRKSDIAMYQVKESGRNDFCFFSENMNSGSIETSQMRAQLRHALNQKDFELYFQPVMSFTTDRIVGVEALLRWHHPSDGLIYPGSFIPAAEKSGIILDIDEWVVGEACRIMAEWQKSCFPEFYIAINISPIHFKKKNIVNIVSNALSSSGVDPRFIEIEVTESALINDSESFAEILKDLKSLGIRISIDDFGTGYSNLAYLQKFKADKLKIDQSFVRRLMNGEEEKAIVHAIIQMATSLRLTTTAEGVEDKATFDLLREYGCQEAQGFLIAAPVTATEFVDFFCGLNTNVVSRLSKTSAAPQESGSGEVVASQFVAMNPVAGG